MYHGGDDTSRSSRSRKYVLVKHGIAFIRIRTWTLQHPGMVSRLRYQRQMCPPAFPRRQASAGHLSFEIIGRSRCVANRFVNPISAIHFEWERERSRELLEVPLSLQCSWLSRFGRFQSSNGSQRNVLLARETTACLVSSFLISVPLGNVEGIIIVFRYSLISERGC